MEKYRIVKDEYGEYYAQVKWFLFWVRFSYISFLTVEDCEDFIVRKSQKIKKDKERKKQKGEIMKYLNI